MVSGFWAHLVGDNNGFLDGFSDIPWPHQIKRDMTILNTGPWRIHHDCDLYCYIHTVWKDRHSSIILINHPCRRNHYKATFPWKSHFGERPRHKYVYPLGSISIYIYICLILWKKWYRHKYTSPFGSVMGYTKHEHHLCYKHWLRNPFNQQSQSFPFATQSWGPSLGQLPNWLPEKNLRTR